MTGPLDWERDGRDWPNRAASRFVAADGIRFHVQVMGDGPVLLLLHGTGAATHSWRSLAPALAPHFTVVAPDLPGHGFTASPARDRLSLPGMAHSLAALLVELGLTPAMAAGHSAGGAILARMALDGAISPRGLVGLNAALLPLGGMASPLLSPVARVVSRIGVVPELFSWHAADERVVRRMLAATGSAIEPEGVMLYRKVMKNPRHAAAALAMMANWDLRPIRAALPRLAPKLLLIVGGNDKTIPPSEATRVRELQPGTEIAVLPGLGHLAHEERPAEIAELMLRFAIKAGAVPAPSRPA
jgi:putative magnesium chelatase accessory protein